MNQVEKNHKAGKILVAATDKLGDILEHNYNQGTTVQKATALLSALQCDLFGSFFILQPDRGPIVARSVILRTILENHGIMIHIRDNEDRSTEYLNSIVEFEISFDKHKRRIAPVIAKSEWTKSTITDYRDGT